MQIVGNNDYIKTFDEQKARFNMVQQQIRPWCVSDDGVLQLMQTLPRENFCLPNQRRMAFSDINLALTQQGLSTGECMLKPREEARILQSLELQKSERVLEIGTGSGFMAALLSQQAAQVVTIEINPELVQMAKRSLQAHGIHNVQVIQMDASRKDIEDTLKKSGIGNTDFDVIVFSGAVAGVSPQFVDMLKGENARIFAVVGDDNLMQATLFRRQARDGMRGRVLWETIIAKLRGFNSYNSFKL